MRSDILSLSLARAVKEKSTEKVQQLLSQGACVVSAYEFSEVPFLWAIKSAPKGIAVSLIKKLQSQFWVVQGEEETRVVNTLLAIAVYAGSIKAINFAVNAGASIDRIDSRGRNFLMVAAAAGHADVASYLISQPGIKINKMDTLGNTALILAACSGSPLITRMLLRAGAIKHIDTDNKLGFDALAYARDTGDSATITGLLSAQLLIAMESGYSSSVVQLLAKGASVSVAYSSFQSRFLAGMKVANQSISTSIMKNMAVKFSSQDEGLDIQCALTCSILTGNAAMLKIAIDAGANVNWMDSDGGNPLLASVNRKNEVAVRALLSSKAKVNMSTMAGNTPLMLAARKGYNGIVYALIAAKADAGQKNNQGLSALTFSRYLDPSTRKALLDANAQKRGALQAFVCSPDPA